MEKWHLYFPTYDSTFAPVKYRSCEGNFKEFGDGYMAGVVEGVSNRSRRAYGIDGRWGGILHEWGHEYMWRGQFINTSLIPRPLARQENTESVNFSFRRIGFLLMWYMRTGGIGQFPSQPCSVYCIVLCWIHANSFRGSSTKSQFSAFCKSLATSFCRFFPRVLNLYSFYRCRQGLHFDWVWKRNLGLGFVQMSLTSDVKDLP